MQAECFYEALKEYGIDFFAGVPDSLLKAFCAILTSREESARHMVAVNEGTAAALAAGHYLATGCLSCVYLQNSGLGNLLNPICSLAHPKVYGIPMLLVVGWRGRPGIKDEPQHLFQGEITKQLLNDLEIPFLELTAETSGQELSDWLESVRPLFEQGKQAAVLVHPKAITGEGITLGNPYSLRREEAIETVVSGMPSKTLIVSTTGKISRELYEIRERKGRDHAHDFLTVGSMGHGSSIALKLALDCPSRPILCLDGDGAALMHMGAMAPIGRFHPANLLHVLLDNEAHETVGGIPTIAGNVDFCKIAEACGYAWSQEVLEQGQLAEALKKFQIKGGPALLRIKVALGSRADLGRPRETPMENRKKFQEEVGRER